MSSTTRRLALAACAALAVAGTVVAPSSTARAEAPTDPQILTATVAPVGVVLGTKKSKIVRFTATTTSPPDTSAVWARLAVADPYTVNLEAGDAHATQWSGSLRLRPAYLDNADAGSVPVAFESFRFEDGDEVPVDERAATPLHLYRAARLTTDASPEPVRAGQRLTVRGQLTRADWERGRYRAYRGQRVELWFGTDGELYRRLGTAVTSRTGRVKLNVRAQGTGDYAWYFPGTQTTWRVQSRADHVRVR